VKNYAIPQYRYGVLRESIMAIATHADLISTAAIGVLIPICADALAAEWRSKWISDRNL